MAHLEGILALPSALVLLLHLHVLSYPHCNAPEYTPDIFSPRRPLRARTNTMEDIVAFLVGKIEGKDKYKSILGGMYPCLQPSDSVGFRASAVKYIETLRTSVIRPAPSTASSNGRTASVNKVASTSSKIVHSQSSRGKPGTPLENDVVAWWWSAIVVRKSLLEECAGERFEKLLLALSTHALFIQIPRLSSLHPLTSDVSILSNELQHQSREYASLLARSLELHEQRTQTAARLNVRAQEIISLRARLALAPRDDTHRPETQRIIAVRDSKRSDLLDAWDTSLSDRPLCVDGGDVTAEDALQWLMSMAGVSGPATPQEEHALRARSPHPTEFGSSKISPIQTLPTASAHHPANIRRLYSLPPAVLIAPGESTARRNSATFMSPALEALINKTTSQQALLKSALEVATQEGSELQGKLDVTLKKSNGAAMRDTRIKENLLVLWGRAHMVDIDFKPPLTPPSKVNEFLEILKIVPSRRDENDAEGQQSLEDRVLIMRDSLQPPIPSPAAPFADVHQLETPPVQPTRQYQSKLPLAKILVIASSSSNPAPSPPTESVHMPRTPRPYQTSTPPTKSRSRSARKARRTSQGVLFGIDAPLLANAKKRGLGSENDERSDEPDPDECDGLRTPTRPRGSIHLPMPNSFRPDDMLADFSLPDFSDGNLTGTDHLSSEGGSTDRDRIDDQTGFGYEIEEVPYEGHSVTLRDMLLKAGDGEDIFHLIDEVDDLENRVADDTMGWG